MKSKYRISFLIITILTLGSSLASVAQNRGLRNIVILATGGTIAELAAAGTQAGYTSGAVTIDAMLAAVPGIKDLANVKGEQISDAPASQSRRNPESVLSLLIHPHAVSTTWRLSDHRKRAGSSFDIHVDQRRSDFL